MFNLFLVKTTRLPVGVHKKIQPNRSSRLASYIRHMYIDRFKVQFTFAWRGRVKL